MNNKTKKIVAGVVLGTFVFGATTPAFAEISKPNINSSVTSITEQNEKTLPLYSNADSETETYGIKGITLKAVKKLIGDNWTKIIDTLDTLGFDELLLKNLDNLKGAFFDAMDGFFDFADSVEEMLQQSFMAIGFNETFAAIAAEVVCEIIM